MMQAPPALEKWLCHRFGSERADFKPLSIVGKSLELSKRGPEFVDTFGEQTIRAYVGFVDLVGYSTRVKGRPPREVAKYVLPFLNALTARLTGDEHFPCLVDKTIGDEVMFLLPDRRQEGESLPGFAVYPTLASIVAAQNELGPDYLMRVGVAFGSLYLGQVRAEGYSEWTVFGEAVNLAKRLCGVMKGQPPIGGAVGCLSTDEPAAKQVEVDRQMMSDPAGPWRITERIPHADLKGISGALAFQFESATGKPGVVMSN